MARIRFEFVILAVLLGIFLGRIPDTLALRGNAYDFFDTVVDVRSEIVRNYVEEPDQKKMLTGAINGMVASLNDPYTDYFDPESLEAFDKQTRATFSGIGAEISSEDGHLTIVSPLEDSPAFEAGVMAGDVILEIDGKSTEGLDSNEAVKRITGPEGTVVKLKLRHLSGEEVTFEITRRRIEIQTVKGFSRTKDHHWNFMLDPDNHIGYIRLTQFSDPSADALKAAIDQLKQEGLKGLILDLRFNPGGLLNQAVEISDMFLSSGTIVSTKGRNSPERIQTATKALDEGDFPVVVMVNEFSASAAEILSGALKDNNRAIILGTRSFGKGSVQQVMALEGGNGAIKVTMAYYYLPSGRNIHRREGADTWGVDPNDGYYVPMSFDEIRKMTELRRDSDVIKDGNGSADKVTPDWLRDKRSDKQLAAALETMVAKVTTGEFKKVGLANATLLAHVSEKANLEKRRDLLQENLDAVNKKLVEVQQKIEANDSSKPADKTAKADKKDDAAAAKPVDKPEPAPAAP
ncbi:MAG: PDZ domain-containing protein [Planctomycetes bacterium]|nr:PDZ domain-containing protein [Planctomycetota bacterium]